MSSGLLLPMISSLPGEDAPAGQTITLGSSLDAFGTSTVDVTAESGWPAGRTPKEIAAQGDHVSAYVRRSWKPSSVGSVDFQAGWQGGSGTVELTLDNDSSLIVNYTVAHSIPTPAGTGVVRYLDDTAAGGGDGTSGTPWNDWATAIAGLAADDVLVVSAKAGGGVYNMTSATGGPSSAVNGCKIVADPDDIAAGRRPRIHVRGDLFVEFADLSADSWDLDTDQGVHGSVYKSKTTFANPGTIIGGIYKNARGEWGRLLHYTDTLDSPGGSPTAGLGMGRLTDTTYPRVDYGTPLYLGPGIYWNSSDQKIYIRLAGVSATVGPLMVDPNSSEPNPPWDWSEYAPESTDANACELLISASEERDGPRTTALSINDRTGWEIENIDFVGGGAQIEAKRAELECRGVRFLGCIPAPVSYKDAFGSDTANWVGHSIDAEDATVTVDRCEFWNAMAPWENQEGLKVRWGAYGHHFRTDAGYIHGATWTARHCLFDGYPTVYRWAYDTVDCKHHHCEFRRVGRDGTFIGDPPINRLDYIRCVIWDGSLEGWAGALPASGNRAEYVGYCLYMNARPIYAFSGWWDLHNTEADDVPNMWVPVGRNVSHSGDDQLNVAIYQCTNLGAHEHTASTPGGAGTASEGWGAGIHPSAGGGANGATHKTRNNICAVYESPSKGQTVQGYSGESHASVVVHEGSVNETVTYDMDYDLFYRDPAVPIVTGHNATVTTSNASGNPNERETIADIVSDTAQEANGTIANPQFAVTPDYTVDDLTLHNIGRYLLAAGSPARTGGDDNLSAFSWPDIDVDGTEFTYAGHAWRGALEPDVPAIEQQVGPLGQMPSQTAAEGTPDITPPSVPTNLQATAASSSRIDLTWNPSTGGVDHYNIYRDSNPTPIAQPTSNSYADTGLTASTLYSYTVSAVDAAGNESAQSASDSATTDAAPSGFVALAGDINGGAGPDLWWRVTETSGAFVEQGGGPSLTNLGTAATRSIDPLVANSDGGKSLGLKSGAYLTGTDLRTGVNSATIGAQVQLDRQTTKMMFCTLGSGGTPGQFDTSLVSSVSAMKPRAVRYNDAGQAVIYTGAVDDTVPIGVSERVDWHLPSSGSVRCFVDGVEVALTQTGAAEPATWANFPAGTWYWFIWVNASAAPFEGLVSELMISTALIPASELVSISTEADVAWIAPSIDAGTVNASSSKPLDLTPNIHPVTGSQATAGDGVQGRVTTPTETGTVVTIQAGATTGADSFTASITAASGATSGNSTVDVEVVDDEVTGDYWVSPDGSDSNPGTEAQPFLTLQKALDVAVAGEVIVAEAGEYWRSGVTYTASFPTSGTSGNPITLRARNPATDNFLSPSLWSTITGEGSGIELEVNGRSWIVIEGFAVRNAGVGIRQTNGANNIYRKCILESCTAIGIQLRFDANDNLIDECMFLDWAPWPGQSGVMDYGVQITAYSDPDAEPSRNEVRNSYFAGRFNHGVSLKTATRDSWLHHLTFEGCEGESIVIGQTQDGTNEWGDATDHDTVIEDCVFRDVNKDGTYYELQDGVNIRNAENTICRRLFFEYSAAATGTLHAIHHQVASWSGNTPTAPVEGVQAVGSKIVGCVIVQCPGVALAVDSRGYSADFCDIFNNVVYDPSTALRVRTYQWPPTVAGMNTSNPPATHLANNVIVSAATPRSGDGLGSVTYDTNDWYQSGTPPGSDINVDPQFVSTTGLWDAAAPTFALTPDFTRRDKFVTQAAALTDGGTDVGEVFTGGAPDIGANEWI